MSTIIKSFLIAFSIYSKIPVPQFPWEEKEMKYVLCFFPFVGILIGLAVRFWNVICNLLGIGNICRILVSVAIPLIISGGFHIDGYMDTMDALHSYQSKEKKLEILKDSHIGAFSVIMLILYYLIYISAFSEITDKTALTVFCSGFMLSRILSGISVVSFKPARENGSLSFMAKGSEKGIVKITLYIELLFCVLYMLSHSLKSGIIVILSVAISFIYYKYKSYKEFGGITGDLAGYFVTICELGIAVAAAISCLI